MFRQHAHRPDGPRRKIPAAVRAHALQNGKAIAGFAREALWRGPWTVEGHRCVNIRIEHARFMRDPDGIHSHGVMTVTAILQEDAPP